MDRFFSIFFYFMGDGEKSFFLICVKKKPLGLFYFMRIYFFDRKQALMMMISPWMVQCNEILRYRLGFNLDSCVVGVLKRRELCWCFLHEKYPSILINQFEAWLFQTKFMKLKRNVICYRYTLKRKNYYNSLLTHTLRRFFYVCSNITFR